MDDIVLTGNREADVDRADLEFVGTATTLLSFGGYTILTDPNFLHQGEHAYLGMGLRAKRLTQPSRDETNLPPIDLVVLSHHHGDHFDRRAAEGLDKALPIVTEPHAAQKLRRQGFRAPIALSTWGSCTFAKGDVRLTITSLPGKHSPRSLGALIPPVMGSLLDFVRGGRRLLRVYITGDTLLHDRIEEIPRRFPDIDLCLLHLGGTRIVGVLLTMDAAQGVQLLQLVRPAVAIPIHYDDYRVFKSTLADFERAVRDTPLATEVRYLGRGERYEIPARRMQPSQMGQRSRMSDEPDDIVEPPNSTVDDWHGQVEQRQERLADEVLAEAGGDAAEAERLFRARGGEQPEALHPDG